jgi:hypothetical protein
VWTPATIQPTNLVISSLAASGTTLFAGTAGDGVFRSVDGGVTWARDRTQPTDLNILALATSSATVFAGTNNAGIWQYPL